MSLGVLIVGLGQIGMGYDLELDPQRYVYTHARAFSQHLGFHLLAAVDPDAGRRQVFEQTFKAPAYATLGAALAHHRPDLVVIATPTAQHKEALQEVLGHSSPVAVLCEKPLSYDLEEGQWMATACAEKDVKLYVNYMRRADPAVAEVKRRLQDWGGGNPVKGVVWYSKGLLHNGSHFFNLLEYWLGHMTGCASINSGRLWAQVDPEPDVSVKFERGEVVFLAAWEEAFSYYSIELLSPKGRLRYEQGGCLVEWRASDADPLLENHRSLSDLPEMIENEMDRYQWNVAEQLARSMAGHSFHLCTGNEALDTLVALKKVMDFRESSDHDH